MDAALEVDALPAEPPQPADAQAGVEGGRPRGTLAVGQYEHCQSESFPIESGPYPMCQATATVLFLLCPECGGIVGTVSVIETLAAATAERMPEAAQLRSPYEHRTPSPKGH